MELHNATEKPQTTLNKNVSIAQRLTFENLKTKLAFLQKSSFLFNIIVNSACFQHDKSLKFNYFYNLRTKIENAKKAQSRLFSQLIFSQFVSQMTTTVAWGSNNSVQLGVGKKQFRSPAASWGNPCPSKLNHC